MAKSLILGMVGFDLFLHIWQWVTGEYFVTWHNYNLFWTSFWAIAFILIIYEFHKKQR